MRVPLSWLRDFVPLDLAPEVIADTCNALGLIVDGVEHIGEGLDGVVVGRALTVRPHPNADRVRLADVDLGTGEPVQIACGAPNLAAGQLVPVATIGTTLPGGMTIERRKLRGEWSNGMICGADEVGLTDESTGGILVLPDDFTVGASFAAAMGIESDTVFDLEIETNRPDAMCIAGVARDLAGKLGLPFAIPEPKFEAKGPRAADLASVAVDRPDLCPRFTAAVLSGVQIAPSPAVIARRLTLAGMRPINNVVDASNYVMLELGQPSHPYDLDRLTGRGLRVRATTPGETLTTLDGSSRPLPDDACVIADVADAAVGLAGIMGGATSEISDDTTTVLLEAAVFEPYAVNRASRQLALRTDASARFERRLDRTGLPRAQARFAEVLSETCPDLVVSVDLIDVDSTTPWPSAPERIAVRTGRVNAVLGTHLGDDDIRQLLTPIGFEVGASVRDAPSQPVTVPPFRPDVEREIDVIEEIARMQGYAAIERRVPTSPTAARLTPHQRERRRLAALLVGLGLTEVWTAAMLGAEDFERSGLTETPIKVTNAMVREESLLRTSFLPGLARTIGANVARRNDDLALFEIGHVYRRPAAGQPLADETEHLAVALARPDDDARTAASLWRDLLAGLGARGLALRAKDDHPGLHPTRAAEIICDDHEGRGVAILGVVGEIDPAVLARFGVKHRVGWIEVETQTFLAHVTAVPQMQPISRYPSSDFDLAFLVPETVAAADVARTLAATAADLLEGIELFDIFRGAPVGEGQRSLAYRLRIAALDRTLTDADVADVRNRAIAAIEQAYGATLRS